MLIGEHIAALRLEGERLAAAATAAGLDAPVPPAPGWCVRDLLAHTGRVHRWAASYVSTGNRCPVPIGGAADPAVPDDSLLAWFRYGHAALLDALVGADPAVTCWTLWPETSALAFWARRQAHETAVHRVDAELARTSAATTTVRPEFGADGVDELLTGFYALRHRGLVAPRPVTLAVRCTDVDAGWTIRIAADGRAVSRRAADHADCVISGAAEDLYLFLWNRVDATRLEVAGDRCVLDLWRDRARIT